METTAGPITTETFTSAERILAGLAAIIGGFMLFLSIFGMAAYAILPVVRARSALANNTLVASLTAIAFVFGAIILAIGMSLLRGRPLPRFSLPPPWLFVGVFVLVVGIGQGVLAVKFGTAYLFPPWHILASMMLPLAALSYAAKRLTPTPGQTVLAHLSWGGAGSILFALVLELLVGVFLVLGVALVLVIALGPDRLTQLAGQLRSFSNGTPDIEQVMPLLSREPLVLIVAALAALAFFTVIGPMIEETFKSLGPGIWIVRTRPTASRALLAGLAAGAGFAFSENLLLGANIVTAQGGSDVLWAPLIVARAGTSLVHVAATATVSLGWHSAFVGGRRARFLGFFFTGFAVHGSWNLLTLLLSTALSSVGMLRGASGSLSPGGYIISALALVVYITLVLAVALWISWLIRWAKRRDEVLKTEPI